MPGVIHRRTGARVDITDLHDVSLPFGRFFRVVRFCILSYRDAAHAAAPHHDKARQQPRRYAIQPDNTPNGQRCTADAPQRQPDGGTDASRMSQDVRRHDAQPRRVAADTPARPSAQAAVRNTAPATGPPAVRAAAAKRKFRYSKASSATCPGAEEQVEERMIHG